MSYGETTQTDPDALLNLVRIISREAESLPSLIEAASEARWERPPSSEPADDTGRRVQGTHGDPTADVALNEARLHLSTVLSRAEVHLRHAAVTVCGVRRGIDRALSGYFGRDEEGGVPSND